MNVKISKFFIFLTFQNKMFSNKNEIESECQTLKIICVFMVVFLTLSFFLNSFVCWIVYMNRELKKPVYYILACICLTNLLASITELPLLILNLFNCRYL